jgi:hypothetical protein
MARTQYTEDFEKARKLYPGTKRGCETEFACLKKHENWKEIVPLLYQAIENQIVRKRKKRGRGEFVPPWKHFKTWLNNNCWEEEENSIVDPDKIAEYKKAKALLKARQEIAEKAKRTADKKALEDMRNEIRITDGPKFKAMTTERLQEIMDKRIAPTWFVRGWLIKEILEERVANAKR